MKKELLTIQDLEDFKALKNAYKTDWKKHYSFYQDFFTDKPPERQKEIAQKHAQNLAYWLAMVNITGGTWKRHGSLKKAFQLHLKFVDELNTHSKLKSYNRFTVFLAKVRNAVQENQGIENITIHKNTKKSQLK